MINQQKDFPELEGKTIIWHYPNRPDKTESGFVVGCNFDIGITIVNADNKDEYLLCINGPMMQADLNISMYKKKFHKSVEMIQTGVFHSELIRNINKKYDPTYELRCMFASGPNASNCPFGQ